MEASKENVLKLKNFLNQREDELTSLKTRLNESDTERITLKDKIKEIEGYETRFPQLECLVKDYEGLIVNFRKESEVLRHESRTIIDRLKVEHERRIIEKDHEVK